MSALFEDLRFAWRMFAKSPGFTAVVIVALALGIGANTTVFTLVNAVLFKGLPFNEPDRIMHLTSGNPAEPRRTQGVSYPDLEDWRKQTKAFSGIAAYSGGTYNLADGAGAPERYFGNPITANTFGVIGQKPLIGRDFQPADEKPGAPPVVLLGFGAWKSRYGGDPGIIGRTVRINEEPTTIIGVMPEGMRFPTNADLWLPIVPVRDYARRDNRPMDAFARLAPGFTLEQARAEMDTISARLRQSYPDTNKDMGIIVKPYNEEVNGGEIRVIFLALLGAVGFVLLIVCANVANLMMAKSVSRAREMSIRAALGASRWRIVRQMLTESVLLGFAGGALGLMIAIWAVQAFDRAVSATDKPYWIRFDMDFTVFAYLAAICIGTGILFGLVPALQVSRRDHNETLKDGGRGHSGAARGKWLSGALVVVECALSLVLLAGAGLMMRSFLAMYGYGEEHDPRHVQVARISLPEAKYKDNSPLVQFEEKLLPRLAAVPGAASVALTTQLPLSGGYGWRYEVEGKPPVVDKDRMPAATGVVISPSYFQVIGVNMLRGRDFEITDGLPGKESVIVTKGFADRNWPGQDPLGKHIRLPMPDRPAPWLTVVGVAPDVKQDVRRQAANSPVLFAPYRQDPVRFFSLVVRSNNPTALISPIRAAVQELDSDLPVYYTMTLSEHFAKQRWPFRVFGTLFVCFAVIALVLATLGIYAVMAHGVSQRTQEIGVRLALGATSRSILALVLSRGVLQLAIGLTLGLAGAFGLTRVLSALLIGVSATDPLTFTTISVLLIAAGAMACIVPARRALRVDPINALRYE